MSSWQLQSAKQRFSELVRAAETGDPQVITRHGQDVAVVIDMARYRQLTHATTGLKDLLESAPWPDEFDIPARTTERDRTAGLFDG